MPAAVELRLDRAEPARAVWRTGSAATNQPKPWRASIRPSSRNQFERPAHRDAAGRELRRQLGLAGQQPTPADAARVDWRRSSSAISW